ncbi:hypothetical protein [Treponema sp.]|uniref:SEL1-like repeat protein n=1 Tax=Treponema sp. TaxID=166 RepID=UPI00388CEE3F
MAEFKIIANEEEQTIQYLIVAEGKETEIDRNNPLRKYDYNSFFSDLTGAMDIIKKNYDKLKFIGTEEEYEKVKDVIDDYYEDEIKLAKMKKVKKEQVPVEENSKEIVSVNEDEQVKKLLDEGKEYRSKGDLVESFLRFKHAADLGSDEGESFVGRSYLLGEGIDQNVDKGLKICNKHLDSSIVLCSLGEYYESIDDEDKAFEFYKKSAEKGYSQAEYMLGKCYLYGIGTDINERDGLNLLEKNNTNLNAKVCLCEYYETKKNYKKSFEIINELQNLTEEKISFINYKMGEYYYYGYGCDTDISKAISYLMIAIDEEETIDIGETGRAYAKSLLGWIFCTEPEESIDYEIRMEFDFDIKSIHELGYNLISEAAQEINDSNTYAYLGFCYAQKLGNIGNSNQFRDMFKIALDADPENGDAYFLLAICEDNNADDKIDYFNDFEKLNNSTEIIKRKVYEYLYRISKKNHKDDVNTLCSLAYLCLKGIGCDEDSYKGNELLKKVESRGGFAKKFTKQLKNYNFSK